MLATDYWLLLILLRVFEVILPELIEAGDFFSGQGAFDFGGDAHHERAWRDDRAGREQRARRDERLRADPHAVHHNRAHSDQASALDVATVQRHVMPDGYFVFQDRRVRSIRDMNYRPVLHIRPRPNPDVMHVTAHDDVEPHRRFLADDDIADHLRALFDVSRRRNLRMFVLKWPNHFLITTAPSSPARNESQDGSMKYAEKEKAESSANFDQALFQ